MSDTVNKPAHYNQGSIECIEAMKIVLTPEEYRGYLKGNVFKYLWREKDKNGNEDIRKGKSYYDRLIEHCDLRESLVDISNGLVKAWTCENGKAKQVYPEQPVIKQSSTTEPDPGEGYRLLSKDPPEKLLDTDEGLFEYGLDGKQWLSVNYSGGEQLPSVYYRRKIDVETLKQSPQPPDGWRWLEVGEVIRKGDKPKNGDAVPLFWIGTPSCNKQFILRRNRFEVGEKVVHGDLKSTSISTVKSVLSDGWVDLVRDGVSTAYHVKDLAPYIEVTEEVTEEVTGEAKPPDGWRWLEVGEVIRKGDRYFKDHQWIGYDLWVGGKISESDRPSIRRNKFEIGEKVIDCRAGVVFTVQHFNKTHQIVFVDGVSDGIESKHFAPYIEETT